MISTRYITGFPFRIIDEKVVSRLARRDRSDKMLQAKILCMHLYDAFLVVCGLNIQVFNKSSLSILHVKAFKGFMLSETTATIKYADLMLRCARDWLEDFGIEESAVLAVTRGGEGDCTAEYGKLKANSVELLYYVTETALSSEGTQIPLRLHALKKTYGETVADIFKRNLKKYIRKYHYATARAKLQSIMFIVARLVYLLPSFDALKLLSEGDEVNFFVKKVYDDEIERLTKAGIDTQKFHRRWSEILVVIREFFVGYELFAKPVHKLYRGKYIGAPEVVASTPSATVPMITPIPLHINDEAGAKRVYDQIRNDVDIVLEVCEAERSKTLELRRARIEAASKYQEMDNPTQWNDPEYLRYAKNCYHWEKYNYTRLSENDIYALYGQSRQIAATLGLLSYSTLAPFIYLLIAEHPEISTGWVDFELYAKNGDLCGLQADGTLAIAEKPRRGKWSQQPVKLTKKAQVLFQEIVTLTQQARNYLRLEGNDDWRYLCLGRGAGMCCPARFKDKNGVCSERNRRSIFAKTLHGRFAHRIDVYRLIRYRTFRTSIAVLVYFKTGSIYAMSQALGHKNFNPKLMDSYFPLAVKQYYLDSWMRVFQNGMIFESLQDSPYLLVALDFHTPEQLSEFLASYRLKPLPYSVSIESMRTHGDKKATVRGIVPVSKFICDLLITLQVVVDKAREDGRKINGLIELWYNTAAFVKLAVNLHKDHNLAACSADVQHVFESAMFSPVLAQKIDALI